MKKIILTAVCALFVLSASAQVVSSRSRTISTVASDKEKVTWGIRAGLNVSDMHYSEKGYGGENAGTTCGFNVGVICDIPIISRYFYVQPGLYLTSKGYSWKDDDDDEYEKESMHPYYLEIPILLSGRYNITKDIRVQIDFGPYFACGLFGNCNYEWKYSSRSGDESFSCFGDDILNRFDCGLDFGVGFTFAKHFYIGFEYEWGLTNIGKDFDSDESLKNRNCMINIGYNF